MFAAHPPVEYELTSRMPILVIGVLMLGGLLAVVLTAEGIHARRWRLVPAGLLALALIAALSVALYQSHAPRLKELADGDRDRLAAAAHLHYDLMPLTAPVGIPKDPQRFARTSAALFPEPDDEDAAYFEFEAAADGTRQYCQIRNSETSFEVRCATTPGGRPEAADPTGQ